MSYKTINKETDENRLVTIYELSEICGLSVYTLKNYCRDKILKKVCTIKNRAYYCLKDSLESIRARRETPKQRTCTRPKNTLCITCNNTGGACLWINEHKPVPGWDAEQIEVEGKVSYLVKKCPKYDYEYYFDESGKKHKKAPPMQWLKDLREGRAFE